MNRIDSRILMIAIRIEYAKFTLKGMSRFNAKACSFPLDSAFSG
ncbi:hypothetical protein SynMVIR181_02230 [Synechococcus sp. MVIR-18-1]|nr:hypothetical protein SynMVIR181_02230 [Synechococcus sp. MVIR-18-1]